MLFVGFDHDNLQRPLDDKPHLRIQLAAEAVLSVLDLVEAGPLVLISVRKSRRTSNMSRSEIEYLRPIHDGARSLGEVGRGVSFDESPSYTYRHKS